MDSTLPYKKSDWPMVGMSAYTAVIQKEGKLYVAKCVEVGTVSQGKTIELALKNLKVATELYLQEFGSKSYC